MTTKKLFSKAASSMSEAALRRRDEALADMPLALRRVYEKERAAYDSNRKKGILFYRERGQVALDLRRNATPEGKRNAGYGTNALQVLIDALMIDRSTVYKAMTLADMYPDVADLTAKIDAAEAAGMTLSWSHFAVLVHAPDSREGDDIHAARRDFVDLVIAHKLSVAALKDEMAARYPKETRPAEMSLGTALRKLRTTTEATIKTVATTTDIVLGALEGDPDMVEDVVLEHLQADREALESLVEKAGDAIRRLTRVERRVSKAKAKSREAEPAAV